MTIAGGPGEFLGVGRGSQWRRSHGGFATTVGDIGGRIRGLVTAEGDVTIPIRIEGMKTAILVLDLGETQAILKAEGNLVVRDVGQNWFHALAVKGTSHLRRR
jgi:hypothetical protein